MRQLLYILILAALLIGTASGASSGLVYHEIQVVDEIGRPIDDLTNLYIYAPGGTTDAVIYMDRGLQNVITIPMTEASANTTLIDGFAYWWGPDGYDFSMSNDNAVGPLTNSGHIARSASEGTLIFPSYLQSMSTTAWLDAQSISMGTGAEWVINGGGVADTLSFIPAADDSAFIVGSIDPLYTASFYVPTGATEGFDIVGAAMTWDGGAALINHNSNHNVGVCTGTSTGATSIGSATAGAFALDTTSTIGINADEGITVTNTTAANDQVYTTAGNFQVVAAEDASLTAVNIDITGAISGFDLDTTNGPIVMTAADATNGDVTISAADIMTLTSTDYKMFDGAATEVWRIDGTAAGSYHSISFTDATANIIWTFPDGGADTIAVMGSTLATNYPDIANSVTGGTNQLIFEGAGVDAHEAIITATDPTADIVWTLPDGTAATVAFMASSLATNFYDEDNSVTGGTNQLIFEGTGGDAHECVLTAADATADVLYTLPDAAAATYGLVTSTLAANGVDIVNAVWGGTNQLIFEGATANAFHTVITPNDATATATISLPDDTGDIAYCPPGVVDYAAGAGALPITHTIITYESIGGAEALTLADGVAGQILQVNHDTDGGNGVITPATALGYTSVDLADDGDMVTFLFVDTQGWIIIGTAGNAAPPVVTP